MTPGRYGGRIRDPLPKSPAWRATTEGPSLAKWRVPSLNEPQPATKPASRLAADDSGVSPVIGVILMVAITVVLAAIVFVLVSELGGSAEAAPNIALATDDGGSSFYVLKADKGLTWSEFTLTGCTTVPTGAVDAGDEASGCGAEVRLTHIATNTLVFKRG